MKNNNIFNAIVNKKSLLDSWNCVLKGNSLTGTDRINIIKFSSNLDYNLDKLGFDLVNDLYMPAPVKIINKYKGIAIVSLVDKIVHYSVKKALEQVFKHEFIEHNYGYIEGKSIYQSIDYINHCIYNKNINFFYKLDIHNFFLSINHEKLMSIINLYDIDELTVNLICKILKTKIYNGEELFDNNKGLVLGSPLSPLLSNIYMIDIDRLFNNRFEMYCRYSDDILIGNSYEFDIESIAKAVCMSSSHLVRLFKKHTGMTPYSYYQEIKVNGLKKALRDKDLSISQAFLSCGFKYPGNFARFFKAQVGMTPSQYRKIMH